MSRIIPLIALALAAAAVAAPYAGADTGTQAGTTVDPLAVSYLRGQGLTPAEVTSWTTGDCSHETKAAPATRCSASRGPDRRPARRQLPQRPGPHPRRGHLLDDRRLLARGQGQLLLRDARPADSVSTQVVR